MFSNRDIADYYDQTEVHYRRFWKLRQHQAIHYGIWEKGVRNFGQALEHTDRVLAGFARIDSSDRVLDAGCGVGGSSLFLARNFGCRVCGVTLSARQASRARGNALVQKLDHLVHFEVKDYTSTGYAPGTFDVVWALESAGTAPDKQTFLDEAYRLLKPGGTLVMADYFKTFPGPVNEQSLMRKWLQLWAVTDLETIGHFRQLLTSTGFGEILTADFTRQIIPSARRMYRASILGAPASILYNFFYKSSPFARHHYRSGFLQYRALKKGLWEYRVIRAIRQGSGGNYRGE